VSYDPPIVTRGVATQVSGCHRQKRQPAELTWRKTDSEYEAPIVELLQTVAILQHSRFLLSRLRGAIPICRGSTPWFWASAAELDRYEKEPVSEKRSAAIFELDDVATYGL
jgi:hypothetical protein